MDLVIFIFFRTMVFLLKIIPFPLIYILSDFSYILIYYLLGYRKQIVKENLTNAFPDKSKTEIKKICKRYYRFLSDLIFEGIKGISMSPNQVVKRHKIINPEILDSDYSGGKSVIGVTGHYGNWEWGAFSGGIQLKHAPIGFYRPLTNKYIDKYLRKRRAKFNCKLVSVKETYETFLENKDKTLGYMLIADQSPTRSKLEGCHWIQFLNQDTPCLYGPEKYAKMFDLPVYYINIGRVKRGFYKVQISQLTDKPNSLKKGELTAIYMKTLENIIIEKPEYWLWSHRRWKYKRTTN